ncbi:MAG TPA: 3-dehydroquinate synthase II [Candidatus Thermoplasmatota archaeon]|nr:3-dehydroquinate synthase II [Candidatus Thermoplasmatota archaeon]
MPSQVWIAVPDGAKDVLTAGLERGFSTFVVPPALEAGARRLGKVRLLTSEEDGLHEDGRLHAPRIVIRGGEDQDRARALAGKHAAVVVAATDWKVIPYENLIAHYQGKGTHLVAEASTPAEVIVLLETLEVGVDAVLFTPRDAGDVLELHGLLAARARESVDLVRGKVVAVRPLGSGDRVCLDTCSLLAVGEGMLVGSSASAMFLVQAESLESEYVAARPFRVNAGPVHAYVLLPGGRTRYLSEMRAGDTVLAVDAQGRTRTVVLGRVKIETRPLILVEAEIGGRPASTILQNAETIRVVTPEGPVSVVDLHPGQEIFLRTEEGGRHFGTAVRETILER